MAISAAPSPDPAFAMTINETEDCLAVASEKGNIYLVETSTQPLIKMSTVNKWQAHDNAIIDLKWRPVGLQNHIVTACADGSFSLWDIHGTSFQSCQPLLTKKRAHRAALKSLSFADPNLLATGSRDGDIRTWDMRVPPSSVSFCTNVIIGAHIGPVPTLMAKIRQENRGFSLSAVTVVHFVPGSMYSVVSTGTADDHIKVWDTRNLRTKAEDGFRSNMVAPVMTYTPPRPTTGPSGHGFSSVVLDRCCRVYAACSDNCIYACELVSGKRVAIFSADSYRTNRFTRITIANDYLVSGSDNGSVPIWGLRGPTTTSTTTVITPKVMLHHNNGEVDSVTGNKASMDIYTCEYGCILHKWSLTNKPVYAGAYEGPPRTPREYIAKTYRPKVPNTGCPLNGVEMAKMSTLSTGSMACRSGKGMTSLMSWLTRK